MDHVKLVVEMVNSEVNVVLPELQHLKTVFDVTTYQFNPIAKGRNCQYIAKRTS
jgi:hypothetical protein